MTFFVLFFPAFGYLGTPKHYKTRENAKCQIDPVLPPHIKGHKNCEQNFCEQTGVVWKVEQHKHPEEQLSRLWGLCGGVVVTALAKMRQRGSG